MTGGMVLWRAGCGGSRTSGSEGGPGRRPSGNARTAPWTRPYFGAFACSRIGVEHIELADFQRIEPALLHELDLAFFEDRCEDAPLPEQAVLAAMAREPGRVTLRRLRNELDAPANLDLLVRRLVERGLVYRTGRATYDFGLPLFRGYLHRRRKLTELTNPVRSETAAEEPPR